MEVLQKRTTQVARGFTYAYYTSRAGEGLPTLLMIHGFPDSPETFADVIRDYLVPNHYGVLALDCLGYAGSSKPLDDDAYAFQLLAQDVAEILDHEGLDKVVSLGHDWGSVLAQCFYHFHPDRVHGLVTLTVTYEPPSPRPFKLDAVLDLTTKLFGYGTFWYWKLFTAPDGAQVLDAHLESLWDLIHGEPETWRDTFCQPDGMRGFLTEDKRQPTLGYATDTRRREWLDRLSRDSVAAPLRYYRSTVFGHQDAANGSIPPDRFVVTVPYLFFGGQRDCVCRVEPLQMCIDAGLLPDCQSVVVDAGHWAHLHCPEAFGQALIAWLTDKF